MMKKKIIFTGGGSGGHVLPAITIIKELIGDEQFEIIYIGGIKSIERDLISQYEIVYFPIQTGKLRRYFSKENFIDMIKVGLGFFQSMQILWKFKRSETLVFSTGGFVSVPVVLAAFLQRKKIYIHEQTSRVGLANRFAAQLANKVFITFATSKPYFPASKTILSGYPLRRECYTPALTEMALNGHVLKKTGKPIFFITGGGNGSKLLNDVVESVLPQLLDRFIVVHQAGKNFAEELKKKHQFAEYIVVPFIGKEMIELCKISTLIMGRAGAGTVAEIMAMQKKCIFIPLKIAQKNEQYFNALEAKERVGSLVIEEKDLSSQKIIPMIDEYLAKIEQPFDIVSRPPLPNGLEILLNEIKICTYNHGL